VSLCQNFSTKNSAEGTEACYFPDACPFQLPEHVHLIQLAAKMYTAQLYVVDAPANCWHSSKSDPKLQLFLAETC
jgi:hypothetical protein